jgi:hypothetical protein
MGHHKILRVKYLVLSRMVGLKVSHNGPVFTSVCPSSILKWIRTETCRDLQMSNESKRKKQTLNRHLAKFGFE